MKGHFLFLKTTPKQTNMLMHTQKSAKVGRYLDLEAFSASFIKGIGI